MTIEERDFSNVPEPARKLMQSYINYGSVEDDDNMNVSASRVGAQEYVALYLLSLLIRDKRRQSPRENVSMNESQILNSHLFLMTYMNVMRERAMMTMFSFGTGSQIVVFHPNVLDLNFIIYIEEVQEVGAAVEGGESMTESGSVLTELHTSE